jgi:hypothetical protein
MITKKHHNEMRILFISLDTTLCILPRRLQALFSKTHTLHVSAFFFKLLISRYIYIYKLKSDVLHPIRIRIFVRLL